MPLEGATIVRVGSGEHTHVYDPVGKVQICRKGKNAGVQGPGKSPSPLYESDAKFVTCYRCQKLASINLQAGRPAWQGPLG